LLCQQWVVVSCCTVLISTLLIPIVLCMESSLTEVCSLQVCMVTGNNYWNQCITLLISRYSNGFHPMLRQFFLIPNRINKFGILRLLLFNCLVGSILSELINIDQYFHQFNLQGSAVCTSVCLTSLDP